VSSKYVFGRYDITLCLSFDRATTSPYAGDIIGSTRQTRSPYAVDDRASLKCAATFSSAVPSATHKKRYHRWGVPDELWVKEAVQKSIDMSSFQQKVCSKCGLHPAAGTQLRRCGSCLAVKYCSSACQTKDWASHRLVCKHVGDARKEELMLLQLAAQNGDVATVKKLLKAGAKVDGGAFFNDYETSTVTTPLFTAAEAGHAAVIAVLLKAGAKINRTIAGGFTPLFAAAHEGHRAAVSMLIEAGAEIDSLSDDQCTPLLIAAEYGHEGVLAVLIKAGGDVNHTSDYECSPVFIAVQNDHRAVLAMLINAGADINSRMDKGRTPLIIAAERGHEGVLVALLEAGAQMTAMDDGCTPLMAATIGRHTSVVAVLRRWTAGIRN